jgi:hypothetical protein
VRFADIPPQLDLHEALQVHRDGRELEVIANGGSADLKKRLEQTYPESLTVESLTLEEIFIASLKSRETV